LVFVDQDTGVSEWTRFRRVLLNYVYYDTEHVYMQGMSDLLAPVLIEIPDEAEAFWCFVDIIKRGLFVCTPTDSDMEKNLVSVHSPSTTVPEN